MLSAACAIAGLAAPSCKCPVLPSARPRHQRRCAASAVQQRGLAQTRPELPGSSRRPGRRAHAIDCPFSNNARRRLARPASLPDRAHCGSAEGCEAGALAAAAVRLLLRCTRGPPACILPPCSVRAATACLQVVESAIKLYTAATFAHAARAGQDAYARWARPAHARPPASTHWLFDHRVRAMQRHLRAQDRELQHQRGPGLWPALPAHAR